MMLKLTDEAVKRIHHEAGDLVASNRGPAKPTYLNNSDVYDITNELIHLRATIKRYEQ